MFMAANANQLSLFPLAMRRAAITASLSQPSATLRIVALGNFVARCLVQDAGFFGLLAHSGSTLKCVLLRRHAGPLRTRKRSGLSLE
jgi:hypothetical protein